MPTPRFSIRLTCVLALVIAPLDRASSQELGVYVGGGVGGIRDVRRPFGAGVSGALVIRDWLAIRADVGQYFVREHRTALLCHPGAQELICTSTRLSSRSHFPLIDAAALVRADLPVKSLRLEAGAGPSWVNVTNEIRTDRDSIYSSRLTSSRAGAVVVAGLLAQPDWKTPVTFEALYGYHMTAKFGACTDRPNDPLCNQHLNFHELRFSVLVRR